MTKKITEMVKLQYPTNEPESLQRTITQIKELLENPMFYQNIINAATSSVAEKAAVVFQTRATPMVLAAGYQPLSLANPVPPLPNGMYAVFTTLKIGSTAGNATFQLRIVKDGIAAIEGAENSVGHDVTEYVPVVFSARATNGTLNLEVRGEHSSIADGSVVIMRVGR